MPLDQGYILAIKYWMLIHIFLYDYFIYTPYLLNYTPGLAIKKDSEKQNSQETPYIGFCRESLALQRGLLRIVPVFSLRERETEEHEI